MHFSHLRMYVYLHHPLPLKNKTPHDPITLPCTPTHKLSELAKTSPICSLRNTAPKMVHGSECKYAANCYKPGNRAELDHTLPLTATPLKEQVNARCPWYRERIVAATSLRVADTAQSFPLMNSFDKRCTRLNEGARTNDASHAALSPSPNCLCKH